MRYVIARYEENQREMAYRIFVTDSLRLSVQNKYINSSYTDMIKKRPSDNRSGDEIAIEVMEQLGLKFAGGE